MIEQFDPRFSLEDIAAQVSQLEELVDVGDRPLHSYEEVMELEGVLQRRVGYAASELMTGRRGGDEEKELRRSYEVYHRLLGAMALDLAGRVYDDVGDSGEVKREVGELITNSHHETVTLDYTMRLEGDVLERSKHRLAHNMAERITVPFAFSVLGSTAVLKTMEVASPLVNLSHEQKGALGLSTAAFILGGFAVRSAMRNGPAQVGTALRGLVNGSYKDYMPPKYRDKKKGPMTTEELTEYYAERRLKNTIGTMNTYLNEYQFRSREDIGPMVYGALEAAKVSFYESYGMAPEEDQGPWYRQWMNWMSRADSAG